MMLIQLMRIVPMMMEISNIPVILLESGVMLPSMNLIHTTIMIERRTSLTIDNIDESLVE